MYLNLGSIDCKQVNRSRHDEGGEELDQGSLHRAPTATTRGNQGGAPFPPHSGESAGARREGAGRACGWVRVERWRRDARLERLVETGGGGGDEI